MQPKRRSMLARPDKRPKTPLSRLLRARRLLRALWDWLPSYFGTPVTFSVAFPPLLVLSIALFTRSLWTNYIFDEQEALLANPYVNGDTLRFWQVFSVDFWGRAPAGTIGSYRPLPNLIWRLLWQLRHHAWLPHWFNVVCHGVNGALVATLAYRWIGQLRAAWFSGAAMVACAVVTEAVCGVVGTADVLCGTFILLTLYAFQLRRRWVGLTTFAFMTLGLFTKESTLTAVPMVAFAALVCAPLDHPQAPRRWQRSSLVSAGAVLAVVFYTYFRRHFFPIQLPPELLQPLPASEPFLKALLHDFMRWFQQPTLPRDPINNPLVEADRAHRIAGALRVYFRGLVQVAFPWKLSGDYSYPQEPVPTHLYTVGSVLGGALLLLPPVAGLIAWVRALWEEYRWRWTRTGNMDLAPQMRRSALIALCLVWIPVTYFPHSNIPVLLPTVRAERFWYLPTIASSWLFGLLFDWLWTRYFKRHRRVVLFAIGGFFGFQALQARWHALDYRSDLVFWEATASAVPNSAKAHLNYGVMLGARNRYEERLVATARAMELAPNWPMAHIYYGDTLCRMKRLDEAWPHYKRGFELGPNQQSLISLALQCMWDEGVIEQHRKEIQKLANDHPGSWLAYLGSDILTNGEKYQGVDPKYRPRGYDQGPQGEEKDKDKDQADKDKAEPAEGEPTTAATPVASDAADANVPVDGGDSATAPSDGVAGSPN